MYSGEACTFGFSIIFANIPDFLNCMIIIAHQVESGFKMQTGAAIVSIRYACFAFAILNLFATGRIMLPIVSELR